jgi:hypothetical protein
MPDRDFQRRCEFYISRADRPNHMVAIRTNNEFQEYKQCWQDFGMFKTTGEFSPGTARTSEHLVRIQFLFFDGDAKDYLTALGLSPKKVAEKIHSCSDKIQRRWRRNHCLRIQKVLAKLGLRASLIMFTGGGHHVYLSLVAQDQRDIPRIRRVNKKLVALTNAMAGFPLFDPQATDVGTRYTRVAGTMNRKYSPPRCVSMVRQDGPSYTLAQLEAIVEQTVPIAVVEILKKYGQEDRHQRHQLALATAGILGQAGWSQDQAERCVRNLVEATQDEEAADRVRAVQDTFAKRDQGKAIRGRSGLADILTPVDLRLLEKLLRDCPMSEPEEPLFLPPPQRTVEPFPTEVLPGALRRFVEEAARALPCPPDFLGVLLLALAGAAIGTSRVLEVKVGWEEGPRVFVAIVADPGSRKSPALHTALKFFTERQKALKAEYDLAMERYKTELARYEAEYAAWESQGGLPEDEPQKPCKPVLQRLYTTNATLEAFLSRLEENPRGMVYAQDELAALVLGHNQYRGGKGADRQHFQSFWSGAQVIVDRKNREEPLILDNPFVTVIGLIPPDVLAELNDPKGREDGFVIRILFVYPDPLEVSWNRETVSPALHHEVYQVFERLWDLPLTSKKVRFTPGGLRVWEEWVTAHHQEVNEEAFPTHLKGAWAKMEAYCARFALILQLCRYACHEAQGEDVDELSMLGSSALIYYFKSHARRVYASLRLTPEDKRVEQALRWIETHGRTASARDLQRGHVAGVKASTEAQRLLRILVDRGYGTITERGKHLKFTLAPPPVA